MRINEFITEKNVHQDAHQTTGLNIKPTDPRHPLYLQSIKRYTGSFSREIANALQSQIQT